MIKNVSDINQTLRWNLQDHLLKPGQTFDVRKFGVENPKQVVYLEDRFVNKFKGAIAKVQDTKSAGNLDDKTPKEPKDKTPKEEMPDLDAMSRKDLEALIAEKELAIEPAKYEKVKELREAVRELLAPSEA